MDSRVDLLAKELDDLHRGRGIHAPDVVDRLGPTLSALVFGDHEPDEVVGRGLLSAHLFGAAKTLPPDLERVFLAALGVGDEDEPLLTKRLEKVGESLQRGPRTMIRWLRDANRAVAQTLERRTRTSDDGNPFAARGWYVQRIESHAVIGPRPRFTGIRDIKITQDGVGVLCESFSVPHVPGEPVGSDVLVEATEGCERVEIDRFSPSSWRLTLLLPRVFQTGEVHRVGLAVTMPSQAFIRPYNVLVPVRRTRSFRATVRFEEGAEAGSVWRYDGVPAPALDDGLRTPNELKADENGLMSADWPDVRQGLAYGIGWS